MNIFNLKKERERTREELAQAQKHVQANNCSLEEAWVKSTIKNNGNKSDATYSNDCGGFL